MGVIDFHSHLPWWIRDPIKAGRTLIEAWSRAGVTGGVVIAVEPSIRLFRTHVDKSSIYDAIGEQMDYIVLNRVPAISRLVYQVDEALREHEELLEKHYRPTRDVIEAGSRFREILPVASYNPDMGVEEYIEEIKGYIDDILGVKIYPTLHFIPPNHRRLNKLYKVLEEESKIVIVHTGCDPGVWELPKMCRYARPSLVAGAARRYSSLRFIIAHLGAYSALSPGIFLHEAIDALGMENIYADTSAVDPFFIKLVVEEAGWDKMLFGSDYPYTTGLEPIDWVNMIKGLDLADRVKDAILYHNAEKLLRTLGFKL